MTKARTMAAALALFAAFVQPALADQPDFDGVTQGGQFPTTGDLPGVTVAPVKASLGNEVPSKEVVAALDELEVALEKGELIPGDVQEKLSEHGETWLATYQAKLQGDDLELDAFYEMAMSEQQEDGLSSARAYEAVARKIQGVELALSRYMLARSLIQNGNGYRTTRPRTGEMGLDDDQKKQADAYFATVRNDLLRQTREIRAVLQQG